MKKLRAVFSILCLALALLPPLPAQSGKGQKRDMLGDFVAADMMDGVTKKVRTKFAAGARTAKEFAPEIEELDDAIEGFADQKDLAAQFALMKAMIYMEVIRDYALAEAIKREAAIPELKPLAEKTMTKARAGARTEAALAEEIRQFDALIAKYAATPSSAGTITVAKAVLYWQVLGQTEKAREIAVSVTKKYAATDAAAAAEELLKRLGPAPKS